MKLISKLFHHQTIVLATLIMYFLFSHACFIPCCPCASGNSQVLSGDQEHHHNKHFTGTHKQNMNVSVTTLLPSSGNNHDCGCEVITVSNYLVEENLDSYRNIKPVRYHFSFVGSGDTIPNTTGMLSHVQHFLSPLIMESSATQTIRTVVILT